MFERLDTLEQFRPNQCGKPVRATYRERKAVKKDGVAWILSECNSAHDIAIVAHRFGLSVEEIYATASRAASVGQFRMAIGNRIRGIIRRIDRARKGGRDITLREAARLVPPEEQGRKP